MPPITLSNNILQVHSNYISRILQNNSGLINKRIDVPIYQRPYTWKNDSTTKLFDDFIEHLDSSPQKAYYLGQLVFILKSADRIEILDGQQRLTTLYIFISALANSLEQLSLDINELTESVIENNDKRRFKDDIAYEIDLLKSFLKDDNDENRFLPLYDEDKKHFKFLLRDKSLIEFSSQRRHRGIEKRHKIISAGFNLFKCINEYVDAKVQRGNDPSGDTILYYKEKLKQLIFIKNILTGDVVEVSYSVLSSGTEFTIFETLNKRGENLNCYDLTRNILINISSEEYIDYKEETIASFDNHIKNNCSSGTRFDEKIGQKLMTSIWNMSNDGKITSGKYMKKFTEFVRDRNNREGGFRYAGARTKDKFIDYVKKLEDCSYAYKELISPKSIEDSNTLGDSRKKKKDLRTAIELFKKTNFSQFYPMYLALRFRHADIDVIYKYIKFIEKIYVNFILVFEKSPSLIENELSRMATEIYNNNVQDKSFNDLLNNHIEEINNFAIEKNIENEKFVQLFSKLNVNNELSKYILLNIIIENNNSFPREILSDDLSLEHILPKTPDFNIDWRDDNFITEEDENGDLVTRALNKSIHERFLDRLGNHTILTRSDNSYNSNRPYADKLPIYNEESMPSITNSNSNHSVTFYENWNAESIESRQVALSLLAKDIWSL